MRNPASTDVGGTAKKRKRGDFGDVARNFLST